MDITIIQKTAKKSLDFDRFRHYEFLTFLKLFLSHTKYQYICDQMQKTALKKLYPTKFYALLKIRPIFLDFGQFSELFRIACDVITVIIENSKKKLCSLVLLHTKCLCTKFHEKTPTQS